MIATSSSLTLCFLFVTVVHSYQPTRVVQRLNHFDPTWESLDSRKLPQWYEDAKVGIFVHWGVFSVPSFGSEWFWQDWKEKQEKKYVDFMQKSYPPNFSYQDFAKDFTAEFYDPEEWAKLFQRSGAKYVVLTSKHHEGYTLWPSKHSFSWNAMDVGPHRDLLGDLALAIRNSTDLHFGLYHSLYEWFNPLYLSDKRSNFTESLFVKMKTLPELYEIVVKYKPEVIWSDGEWEASDDYWTSKEFLAWLYNESPVRETVVVNDRWGHECLCKHGDFYTCSDRYNPGVLQSHKWENAMTIDKSSWGFRREAVLSDYLTIHELILEMMKTVSCGGNILINVGPTKEGTIGPIFEERLIQLGDWLAINGDAVYKSRPWIIQNDTLTSDVWYTARPSLGAVFATFFYWPSDNELILNFDNNSILNIARISLLSEWKESLPWRILAGKLYIELPNTMAIFKYCAWVIKFELE